MHGWETRMLLRHYLQRGVSKAALARRVGVSRRTIHEWVETGQLDRDLSSGGARYSPRPAVPHKLAPYTGIIEARLEEFPGLSAQRLFDEVRAAGYPGGYSRVRDYVRAVRPREPVEAVVRFETPAGRQGQVDFATFTLPWSRRHALVVVLSHSRLLWLRFYRRQTMAVLTEGLERAFARFGGVPKELLFDQMRAVVLSDGRVGGGELVLNAEFLRVAAHWGFHPRACRPYRAQTKGKVERPIRYIRDSFFYGRAFANDEDLNEQASRWLEGTANVRRHSTTGERSDDRVRPTSVISNRQVRILSVGIVRARDDSCTNACAGKARSRRTRCRDVIFETLFETLWVSNPIRPRSATSRNRVMRGPVG